MIRFLRFYVTYFVFFILVSLSFKLLFLAYQWQLTRLTSLHDIACALLVGLRLDASLSAYFSIATLSIYTACWWNRRVQTLVFFWLNYILIVVLGLIAVIDSELYRNWLTHIDASVFQYLATPREAMASVPVILIVVLVLAWGALSAALIFVVKRTFTYLFERPHGYSLKIFAISLVGIALMIVPLRGNLGIVPINTGTVFFSTNTYANHLAVNPAWNFMYSMGKLDVLVNKYHYMDQSTADSLFASMSRRQDQDGEYLHTKRPNVVIIIMESFSVHLTSALGSRRGITPCFDSLAREGLLFSNMYAASYRTDKALVAVMNGYPAQPLNSIIKFPGKTQHLPFISHSLNAEGYTSAFIYGGDKNFSNINSLLLNGGVSCIIDLADFDDSMPRNRWGVADECVMHKTIDVVDTLRQPFFCTVLTQSNHEPYTVPGTPRFAGIDDTARYFSTSYYADSCLGVFTRLAKSKAWWANTLVIVVGDHSSRLPGNMQNTEPRRYRIPMLWYGGALKEKHRVVSQTCSQTDIASTLLGQMDIPSSHFRFSNNILDSTARHYALFTFYDGFGFITDSSQQVFDNENRSYITNHGRFKGMDSLWAKATWQVANDDFIKK